MGQDFWDIQYYMIFLGANLAFLMHLEMRILDANKNAHLLRI